MVARVVVRDVFETNAGLSHILSAFRELRLCGRFNHRRGHRPLVTASRLSRCDIAIGYLASFQQSQAESVLESKMVPLRIPSSTSASERTTGNTFSSGSRSCALAVSESSA